MKCEKCGHQNIDGNNVCEICKTPLKIEIYNKNMPVSSKKGIHIDIEDINEEEEQLSFNQTKKSVRNFLLFLFLTIIIGVVFLIGIFIVDRFSQDVLNEYEDIMEHSSLALIYLGYDEDIDKNCLLYSENYSFDYLNIEANKLSVSKKKKIRKELNIYNITSTLVVVQDGVPIAYYSNLTSTDELLAFLQIHNLVPSIIEETTDSLNTFDALISSTEDAIIYLPTTYDEETDTKSETIKEICEENGLIYGEVRGYALSHKQLRNIMSRIGFSEIQDDLILYISDGKIMEIFDSLDINENDYFHLFSNRSIIDITSEQYLISVNKSQLSKIISEKSTNIIFFVSENCSYCDRVKLILGKMANQYQIEIYYFDATEHKSEISDIIKEIGYSDGLTVTPFVLISENNQYVDSIIGLADKDIYINKFSEYGIIK